MKTMNKVFTVSVLAIMAVSASHATIVSETMLTKTAGTYDKDNTVEMAIADAKAAGTNAVQSVTAGSANGTIAVNGSNVAVTGLKSAAYTESSAYAPASHNQASSTINAMTGYSKPNATSAISTSDTLNSAIGKLEKALDGKQATMTVDSALDSTSTNPVQNKVVNTALGNKIDKTVANDKDSIMVRDGSGNYVKGTSSDISVATSSGTTTVTVTHATSADSATTASSANSVAWGNVTGKPSTFAPSSHKQASNTINAMTGYAKADSAAAITTSDTLNSAIGKLEKALDGKQASGSYVPTTRTVNSKALSSDITLTASDVGAAAASHNQASNTINAMTGYSKPSATSAISTSDTLNSAIGKLEKALDGKQASGDYVPTSRTVNNKALSSNISLTASDVGAVAAAQGTSAAKKVMSTDSTGNVVASTITGSGNVAVSVADSGAITVTGTQYTLPNATTSTKGGVIVGSNIGVSSGTISVADASPTVKGVMTKAEAYDANLTADEKKATAASVYVAEKAGQAAAAAAVSSAASTYQKASDSNVGTAGTYIVTGKGVATNLANLDSALGKVRTSAGAIQIPSGSETSSTYASIWVE